MVDHVHTFIVPDAVNPAVLFEDGCVAVRQLDGSVVLRRPIGDDLTNPDADDGSDIHTEEPA